MKICQRSFASILMQALLVLLALSVPGCSDQSSEENLRQRVIKVMQARIDKRWDIVYDFFSMEYKKDVSKEVFLKFNRPVVLRKYLIESIDIAADKQSAQVRLRADYTNNNLHMNDVAEVQHWFVENGKWYQKIKDFRKLFFDHGK